VIAAINAAGQVVGVVLRDESIRLDQLLELMRQVKAHYGRRRVVIFLDNLRMHYNSEFKSLVAKHGHELLYNASY